MTLLVSEVSGQRTATLDLRNASEDGTDQHHVVFLAIGAQVTSGSPGHAFVSFGTEYDSEGICRAEAFGLYPDAVGARTLLGPVPGQIANEAHRGNTGLEADRLIVRVTRTQFRAAEAVRRQWAGKKTYDLVERDCVSFMAAVASKLGLKCPDRRSHALPRPFLHGLIDLNTP